MASFKIYALEPYIRSLERLSKDSTTIMKRSVFNGAKIVADTVKDGLKSIPTGEGLIPGLPPYGSRKKPIKVISKRQKEDLINGLGIARFDDEGDEINTHIGFDGYGSVPTKKHPGGIPNALLARAITSGTSFRVKNPIIRTSVNKAKKKSIAAMQKEIEKGIGTEMK